MNSFFLTELKEFLKVKLEEFMLEQKHNKIEQVNIFIGDFPPKKNISDHPFPAVLIIPVSGYSHAGQDVVSVALVPCIYCGEAGSAETAEMDMALLISIIKRALAPCEKEPLCARYKLEKDSKGTLFTWKKSDLQPRPFMQASLMTDWIMKGLE